MDLKYISGGRPIYYSIASSRMRCNPSARWGPGTTKEKQVDTEGSKELKQRMDQMLKEREKQNSMWTQTKEEKVSTPVFSSTISTSSTTTSR